MHSAERRKKYSRKHASNARRALINYTCHLSRETSLNECGEKKIGFGRSARSVRGRGKEEGMAGRKRAERFRFHDNNCVCRHVWTFSRVPSLLRRRETRKCVWRERERPYRHIKLRRCPGDASATTLHREIANGILRFAVYRRISSFRRIKAR